MMMMMIMIMIPSSFAKFILGTFGDWYLGGWGKLGIYNDDDDNDDSTDNDDGIPDEYQNY
jgi:hypothetical protein